MSKMLDNLARVRDEQDTTSRPSLFVVKEAPAATSAGRAMPRGTSRPFLVWGIVGILLAGLGASYLMAPPAGGPAPEASQPAMQAAGEADGARLIREGRLEDARTSLEKSLAREPGSLAVALNLAYVRKELGKPAEAEALLRAALAKFPENSTLLNNLGALALRQGRLAEAERYLRQAAEADTASVEARLNLMGALEKKHEWSGALAIVEELLSNGAATAEAPALRERARRLRSLSSAQQAPKEAL